MSLFLELYFFLGLFFLTVWFNYSYVSFTDYVSLADKILLDVLDLNQDLGVEHQTILTCISSSNKQKDLASVSVCNFKNSSPLFQPENTVILC